jgi:hypothetical protein
MHAAPPARPTPPPRAERAAAAEAEEAAAAEAARADEAEAAQAEEADAAEAARAEAELHADREREAHARLAEEPAAARQGPLPGDTDEVLLPVKRQRPAALHATPPSARRAGPRVSASPRRQRPATRPARSSLLPHNGVVLALIVLAAIGAGVVLLKGLLDITVAP